MPRYPAPSQYEDGYPPSQATQVHYDSGAGYQDGYQGFAGLAGAPQQRSAWNASRQETTWGTGAQRAIRDTGHTVLEALPVWAVAQYTAIMCTRPGTKRRRWPRSARPPNQTPHRSPRPSQWLITSIT